MSDTDLAPPQTFAVADPCQRLNAASQFSVITSPLIGAHDAAARVAVSVSGIPSHPHWLIVDELELEEGELLGGLEEGSELLDGEDETDELDDGLDEMELELELDREEELLLDEEGGLDDDEEDEEQRQLQPFGIPIRTPYRLQCSGATAFLP